MLLYCEIKHLRTFQMCYFFLLRGCNKNISKSNGIFQQIYLSVAFQFAITIAFLEEFHYQVQSSNIYEILANLSKSDSFEINLSLRYENGISDTLLVHFIFLYRLKMSTKLFIFSKFSLVFFLSENFIHIYRYR